MSPPRLTGALRSFSNVSKHDDCTVDVYDLKAKRLKRQELFSKEGLTWQKITQFFNQHLEKGEQQAAAEELKKILQAAKQIVGTEFGQEAIESAAVFLFRTFYNTDQVGHEETRAIKHMFGPFPSSAADTSCAAVGRLVALVDGDQVEAFVRAESSRRLPDRGSAFGRNIAFSFDAYALDYLESLPWCEEGVHSGFSLDYDKFLNNQQGQKGQKGAADDSAPCRPAQNTGDGALLRNEVEQYLSNGNMGSSSAEDLCTSLFEMLASHKSDDELQNELFELLGPEGFEMIERLLQRRTRIVDSLLTACRTPGSATRRARPGATPLPAAAAVMSLGGAGGC
ncbi:hypothetical protein MATL_G00133780 [Megalops atlanticus]|uniref:Activating signal cointegrator 1 complex subunit 3 n=1 Tax=Megalops atlanticus TaxID=7932 RepID=A0A9D3TC63_MEGAT|nr:hypothetical protein MATL_G00133780 [Megalops atlanticus]